MMNSTTLHKISPPSSSKIHPDVEAQDMIGHNNEPKKPSPPTAVLGNLQQQVSAKHLVVAILVLLLAGTLLWDVCARPPDERFILFDKENVSHQFLSWVESHPYQGLAASVMVLAASIVLMIPIGTALTIGCGTIYRGVYGWTVGMAVATGVTWMGSTVGSAACFLLGRYVWRDRVRLWMHKKYPIMLHAIDTAVSERGLRIMAMLHLTPILPLGPVSYLCGTTSMVLGSFCLARVASLPLLLLYVFMGASTGSLLSENQEPQQDNDDKGKKMALVFGMVLSAVMIGCVSYYIRKELKNILERQKQEGTAAADPPPTMREESPHKNNTVEESVEMGITQRRTRSATVEMEALLDGDVNAR